MTERSPHTAANTAQADWVFHTQLVRFGLRGDPVLWARLKDHFAAQGIPETEAQFTEALTEQFQAITGHDINDAPDRFGVQSLKRKQGGMSNGMISAGTWRRSLLPLLIARHKQLRSTDTPPEKPLNSMTFEAGNTA